MFCYCLFYKLKPNPPSAERLLLVLQQYSLYRGDLERTQQCLQGTPVLLCSNPDTDQWEKHFASLEQFPCTANRNAARVGWDTEVHRRTTPGTRRRTAGRRLACGALWQWKPPLVAVFSGQPTCSFRHKHDQPKTGLAGWLLNSERFRKGLTSESSQGLRECLDVLSALPYTHVKEEVFSLDMLDGCKEHWAGKQEASV